MQEKVEFHYNRRNTEMEEFYEHEEEYRYLLEKVPAIG